MKLLLDTHIWYWMLAEPQRLRAELRDRLDNPQNELWLSPVSIWELLILAEKGRVDLGNDPFETLREALNEIKVRNAGLDREVAFASRQVDLPHQDPADRFIAATAKVLGLTLVTQDERLLRCRDFEVLANLPA